MSKQKTLTKQMVEDIGEYHVCLELSRMGFRAVRTSQNAKGVCVIEFLMFSHTAKKQCAPSPFR